MAQPGPTTDPGQPIPLPPSGAEPSGDLFAGPVDRPDDWREATSDIRAENQSGTNYTSTVVGSSRGFQKSMRRRRAARRVVLCAARLVQVPLGDVGIRHGECIDRVARGVPGGRRECKRRRPRITRRLRGNVPGVPRARSTRPLVARPAPSWSLRETGGAPQGSERRAACPLWPTATRPRRHMEQPPDLSCRQVLRTSGLSHGDPPRMQQSDDLDAPLLLRNVSRCSTMIKAF